MAAPPPVAAVTDAHRDALTRRGWVIQRRALPAEAVAEVATWFDEVAAWAERRGPGLHHHEATDGGPALARSEDLLGHDGLRGLLGVIVDRAGALWGEPAALFKEKINFKQPGGAGFAPHQDATAYRFAHRHLTCMVPVDPARPASGGLEVAEGAPRRILDHERGRIDDDVVAALRWRPVELVPGDLLWFDGLVPHRSGTNTTGRARRALFATCNPAADGDLRTAYYADKRAELAAADGTFGGQRVRVSVNDDFLGRPVAP